MSCNKILLDFLWIVPLFFWFVRTWWCVPLSGLADVANDAAMALRPGRRRDAETAGVALIWRSCNIYQYFWTNIWTKNNTLKIDVILFDFFVWHDYFIYFVWIEPYNTGMMLSSGHMMIVTNTFKSYYKVIQKVGSSTTIWRLQWQERQDLQPKKWQEAYMCTCRIFFLLGFVNGWSSTCGEQFCSNQHRMSSGRMLRAKPSSEDCPESGHWKSPQIEDLIDDWSKAEEVADLKSSKQGTTNYEQKCLACVKGFQKKTMKTAIWLTWVWSSTSIAQARRESRWSRTRPCSLQASTSVLMISQWLRVKLVNLQLWMMTSPNTNISWLMALQDGWCFSLYCKQYVDECCSNLDLESTVFRCQFGHLYYLHPKVWHFLAAGQCHGTGVETTVKATVRLWNLNFSPDIYQLKTMILTWFNLTCQTSITRFRFKSRVAEVFFRVNARAGTSFADPFVDDCPKTSGNLISSCQPQLSWGEHT